MSTSTCFHSTTFLRNTTVVDKNGVPMFFMASKRVPKVYVTNTLYCLVSLRTFIIRGPLYLLRSRFNRIFNRNLPKDLLRRLPRMVKTSMRFHYCVVRQGLRVTRVFSRSLVSPKRRFLSEVLFLFYDATRRGGVFGTFLRFLRNSNLRSLLVTNLVFRMNSKILSPTLLRCKGTRIRGYRFSMYYVRCSVKMRPARGSICYPYGNLHVSSNRHRYRLLYRVKISLGTNYCPHRRRIESNTRQQDRFVREVLHYFFYLIAKFFRLMSVILSPSRGGISHLVPFTPSHRRRDHRFANRRGHHHNVNRFLISKRRGRERSFREVIRGVDVRLFFGTLIRRYKRFLPCLKTTLGRYSRVAITSSTRLLWLFRFF